MTLPASRYSYAAHVLEEARTIHRPRKRALSLAICLPIVWALGCQSATEDAAVEFGSSSEPVTSGYVLKQREGESLFGGNIVIKASPKTGSLTAMMATTTMAEGASTGLHYHKHTDEFFYVIKGTGNLVLGEQSIPIEEGDSVFVPAGLDHKVEKLDPGEPLEVVFFTERPELADEFRESHRINGGEFFSSLEELNALAREYGTVYKTLE